METATVTQTITPILKQILGPAGLNEDLAARKLLSQDIWSAGVTADFIAVPETVDQLQQTVAACRADATGRRPRVAARSRSGGIRAAAAMAASARRAPAAARRGLSVWMPLMFMICFILLTPRTSIASA